MMFTLARISLESLVSGLNDLLGLLNETSKSSELSRHCVEVSEDFIALIKKSPLPALAAALQRIESRKYAKIYRVLLCSSGKIMQGPS